MPWDILCLLLSLQSEKESRNTFFAYWCVAVYQSLIRTCSHPVVMETEEQEARSGGDTDLAVRRITYKDYLQLWSGLLQSAKVKVGDV